MCKTAISAHSLQGRHEKDHGHQRDGLDDADDDDDDHNNKGHYRRRPFSPNPGVTCYPDQQRCYDQNGYAKKWTRRTFGD